MRAPRRLIGRTRRVIALAGVVIALGGCATIRRHATLDTEQVLAAAGVGMKLGDTPEKLANLQALKPRTLVPQERGGQLYYGFNFTRRVPSGYSTDPRPLRSPSSNSPA